MNTKKAGIVAVVLILVVVGVVLFYSQARAKETPYLCDDTDNGVNSQKRGIVKFVNDDVIMNRMDECQADILVEYSCGKNKIENTNINCASSKLRCYAGACQPVSKLPAYLR